MVFAAVTLLRRDKKIDRRPRISFVHTSFPAIIAYIGHVLSSSGLTAHHLWPAFNPAPPPPPPPPFTKYKKLYLYWSGRRRFEERFMKTSDDEPGVMAAMIGIRRCPKTPWRTDQRHGSYPTLPCPGRTLSLDDGAEWRGRWWSWSRSILKYGMQRYWIVNAGYARRVKGHLASLSIVSCLQWHRWDFDSGVSNLTSLFITRSHHLTMQV